jgi:hypothetical protein
MLDFWEQIEKRLPELTTKQLVQMMLLLEIIKNKKMWDEKKRTANKTIGMRINDFKKSLIPAWLK